MGSCCSCLFGSTEYTPIANIEYPSTVVERNTVIDQNNTSQIICEEASRNFLSSRLVRVMPSDGFSTLNRPDIKTAKVDSSLLQSPIISHGKDGFSCIEEISHRHPNGNSNGHSSSSRSLMNVLGAKPLTLDNSAVMNILESTHEKVLKPSLYVETTTSSDFTSFQKS